MWGNYFREQSDKLLLLFLYAVALAAVAYFAPNKDLVSWATKSADMVLGAIMALVTGAIIKAKDKPE
jgi:hypothetical protein